MAQRKISVELEADASKVTSELQDLRSEIDKLNKEIASGNKETKDGLKDVEKASKSTAKGVSRIGNALKAAGIGLVIAAFAKLTDVFNENQKVTNFFNTTFEALSLAFNDFFNFLNNNIGTVVGYFKNIFSDPKQAVYDFATAIYENLIERFNSLLDTLGFLASAVKKVFEGDFAGALESVKSAGKEAVDVITGVPDSFDKIVEAAPSVIKGITDYTKSTIQAAKETVELNRAAEIGIAKP
jgi:phage-related protein